MPIKLSTCGSSEVWVNLSSICVTFVDYLSTLVTFPTLTHIIKLFVPRLVCRDRVPLYTPLVPCGYESQKNKYKALDQGTG